VHTFEVRPQIVAGTANIQGAIEIRADDLRRGGARARPIDRPKEYRPTDANAVQPAQTIPSPQALGSGENGRLGDNPPRAASGSARAAALPVQHRQIKERLL
jgi:hypothetical protein